MSSDVKSTLQDRGSTYGRFDRHAGLARRLIEVISSGENFSSMPPDEQHSLCYIADKMARVLTGRHDHRDSWLDMAGYATLIVDRIDGTGAYAEQRPHVGREHTRISELDPSDTGAIVTGEAYRNAARCRECFAKLGDVHSPDCPFNQNPGHPR